MKSERGEINQRRKQKNGKDGAEMKKHKYMENLSLKVIALFFADIFVADRDETLMILLTHRRLIIFRWK